MEVVTKKGARKYRPHNKRMLVSQDEAEKTMGKTIELVIPDTVQVKPSSGKVIEVSTDIEDINVGDIVLFGPQAGLPVELDGKEYLLLHATEVIMIGEEDDDIASE